MVDPLEAGVGASSLPGCEVVGACVWLRGYAARVRSAAAKSEGVSALAVVHASGVEVSSFGVTGPFFAKDFEQPITHVIVLVAGPSGFKEGVLERFEAALMSSCVDGGPSGA